LLSDLEVRYHETAPQTYPRPNHVSDPESYHRRSVDTTFPADNTNLQHVITATVRKRKHPDRATIYEILFDGGIAGLELEWITEYLARYFELTPHGRVTGFRAVVTLLLGEIRGWPVIEWREGYDTEVLAIFKIEPQTARCCCLMHYGEGIGWYDRKRWRRSLLTWQIGEVDDLKELLVVAQHILGMLHWSDTDILNLYFQDSPTDCSDEEFDLTLLTQLTNRLLEHAKRVVSQLLRIKQVKTLFEKVSPIVEKLSSRSGKVPHSGNC